MATISQSRRRFIQFCTAVIGGFGIWQYLGASPKPEAEILWIERINIPSEGALVYVDQQVAVLRRAEQLYALSLVCTHLGCTVQVNPDGIICPCHGSHFDLAGKVKSGPATRALERLELRLRDDGIEVILRGQA
jgi:Rieske Fe-S protein